MLRTGVTSRLQNVESHLKVFELCRLVSGAVSHTHPSRVNDNLWTETLQRSRFIRGKTGSGIRDGDSNDTPTGEPHPCRFVALKDRNVVIRTKKFCDEARPDKSARPRHEKPHRLSVTRNPFVKADRPVEHNIATLRVRPGLKISVVTPCYNEEDNVERCAAEVARVMAEELPEYEYEHIFCDNASLDATFEKLKVLAAQDSRIKVILNSRNVGPFRNMANGLRSTSGDLVVSMVPADIQDPPSVIPEMVAAMTPTVDVVYGVRANRRENFLARLARNAYYALVKSNGGGRTPPRHAGEFLLARRHVIDAVIGALGSYPYIRGLVAQATEKYATVTYQWGVREHGKSRNSLPDLMDQALNGLVSTAKAPIRVALILGIFLSIGGIVAGIVNVGIFLFGSVNASPGIPTLIVGMFLFGGVQLFFLGLIGEYVMSIHSEVSPRPNMVETARINF